jgi:hypothetical protein
MPATAPAYAINLDDTAAHVFACPHCLSGSVGMNSPIQSNRQEGLTKVDITTIPLYCATCEAEWEVDFIASSRNRGLQPIDLVARIVKGA